MKILILSSNAKAANGDISFQMLQEFKSRGHLVKIMTNFCREKHEDIISYHERPDNKYDLLKKRIKIVFSGIFRRPQVNNKYYFQDIYETIIFNNSKVILKKIGFTPDVICLHFNQHFITAKNLYQLNKLTGAPIFILLIDMAPMTGGCHYAWDCEGYEHSCGNCPGLYSKVQNDLSFKNMAFKKKYFDKTDITIVAASEWQLVQARKSNLFKNKPLIKILTSFDSEIFKPVYDKKVLRNKYNISAHDKVIFFGAASLNEKRKGVRYLLEALSILKIKFVSGNIQLLLAGNSDDSFLSDLPFSYINLGFVDLETLTNCYKMADVFACPSIEDSGPTMINQSILCGTPVVSFNLGVALDLVLNFNTGYKAKLKDPEDMAFGLNWLLSLSEEKYDQIVINCRNVGVEKCSYDNNIILWTNLFLK